MNTNPLNRIWHLRKIDPTITSIDLIGCTWSEDDWRVFAKTNQWDEADAAEEELSTLFDMNEVDNYLI